MKKMLLHVCCAPCLTSVFERLKAETDYEITLFFSNSNILPKAEYERRKDALIAFVSQAHKDTTIIFDEYQPAEFFEAIAGKERLGEGSERCGSCIGYRLMKTVKYAKENGFDIFATTLSVSPHKNAALINGLGRELSEKYGIEFFEADFKKRDGYLRSLQICKEYQIYRQNYCGCNLDQGVKNEL